MPLPQSPARRPATVSRPAPSPRRPGPAGSRGGPSRAGGGRPKSGFTGKPAEKADHEILVLTEGKRDESTGEVRKTRLFIYSEDFVELFKLLQATAQFIRANPVPDEVKKKRNRHWSRKADE